MKKARVFNSERGWKEIAGKKYYFKSNLEYLYAMYLQTLMDKKLFRKWEYEPKIFYFEEIKRGTRSYTPDFKITHLDGTHHWVETKGYMDAKSKTKIKRFEKYYPSEKLTLVLRGDFRK